MLHFGTHGSLEFMPGKQVSSRSLTTCARPASAILTMIQYGFWCMTLVAS